MTDFLGWIGTVVMMIGSIDIANLRVRGLWLMLIGNVLWAGVGCLSGLTSLVGVSILMGVLDIYGITKWNQR